MQNIVLLIFVVYEKSQGYHKPSHVNSSGEE